MNISLADFIKVFGVGPMTNVFAKKFGNEMEASAANLSAIMGSNYTKACLSRLIVERLTSEEVKELAERFNLEFCDNRIAKDYLLATKLTDNRKKGELLEMFADKIMQKPEKKE